MENSLYNGILNAMPETSVYVVGAEDHCILYMNDHARSVSPNAREGIAFHDVWRGSHSYCPLLSLRGEQQSGRVVSYHEDYGGLVDITTARLQWENGKPAMVVTATPRADTSGYTYRKILYVDLDTDRCIVLKSAPDMLLSLEDGSMSKQLEKFARSGAVHPGDVERFVAFTGIEHLRSAANPGQGTSTLIYRRQMGEDAYRWNLMEVIPWEAGEGHAALMCFKDVHDVLREGLEREGVTARSQELVRTLGERNSNIYTVDLNAGTANPVRVDGQMREDLQSLPWVHLMRAHILERLHEAYRPEFERRFSLEGLRRARDEGQQKSEMLCQWMDGEALRYISVTASFSGGASGSGYTVVALQDVDDRMRQELAHTKRDMQMAAILKSRYRMLNTVYLDSGQCERVNLAEPNGPGDVLVGDYETVVKRAVDFHVHPGDAEKYQAMLSLEHLRQKAEEIQDYGEEVCQYRTRGENTQWIELHILYSRQQGQVMVNILGQDITREKNKEEERLQALEDWGYMITGLSSMFFSTYYIDLDRDTFRAVTQQHRVSDVLGSEVNFTTAIELYANHFIHSDDREDFKKAMSIQNLWSSLRWWQPCVTVDFRKAPDLLLGQDDSEEHWVRASAILARTGPDDLPKTVVYVARDIDGKDTDNGKPL